MTIRYSTGLRNAVMDAGFKPTMDDGELHFYSGTQPADADQAETGTKLLVVTEASGAHTTGVNGLDWLAAVAGVTGKEAAVWSGVGIAAGVAGWFRFYSQASPVTGLSTTAKRFDGSIGTSGADLNIGNTTIAVSATTTVDSFTVTQPANA